MNVFKIKNHLYFLLGILLSMPQCYGQKIMKSQHASFTLKENTRIELNSNYTNIEFEQTDNNKVEIDAIMTIDGLSTKEANAYFKQWNFSASQQHHKLIINSFLNHKQKKPLETHGYYNGYFLKQEQLSEMTPNVKFENSQLKQATKKFDYQAYIEKGDDYLIAWQKKHQEPVGKRWFHKTKKERILLQKATKKQQPKKNATAVNSVKTLSNTKAALKSKLKKYKRNKVNVRSLSKRATINKTLKIKIPRHAKIAVKVRHGKVTISEISNLKADLSYVLLEANKILGANTYIKAAYTNFEINHWEAGRLDVAFSDFVLIKKATHMQVSAKASLVSIDAVTAAIKATGNFKMLSLDLSPTIQKAIIDVEDSKKVWIKLPNSPYNLQYNGMDSRLIYPKKFSLETDATNASKQFISHHPVKNNARFIDVKALSSVLQVYDIPWGNLKIKSLEKL